MGTFEMRVEYYVLLWLVACEVNASFMSGLGSYDVVIDRIGHCDDQGKDSFKLKFMKYRHGPTGYAHRGTITWPLNEEESKYLQFRIDVYKHSTDWTLLAKYEAEFCDAMKREPDAYNELLDALGSNHTCPIAKGVYSFEGWNLNIDFSKFIPTLQYGKYKGIITLLYKNAIHGCVTVWGDVKQKI